MSVTAIHSVLGLLEDVRLTPSRRSWHTTAGPRRRRSSAAAAATSVRARSPRPTVVLFLDETPEFDKAALRALRTPLERGHRHHRPCHRVGDLPGAVPGSSSRPIPAPAVTAGGGGRSYRVLGGDAPQLLRQALGAASRPRRPPGARAGKACVAAQPSAESTRVVAARVAAARAVQRERWRGLLVEGWRSMRTCPGPCCDRRLGASAHRRLHSSADWSEGASACAATTAASDVPGPSRTSPGCSVPGGIRSDGPLPPPPGRRRGMSDERLTRVALSRLVEPGEKGIQELLSGMVPPRRSSGSGRNTAGSPASQSASGASTWTVMSRPPRRSARASSCRGTPSGRRLDDLGVPPWCLWLRGRADLAGGDPSIRRHRGLPALHRLR